MADPDAVTEIAMFHPFSGLPPELRALIWDMTAGSRVLDVRVWPANAKRGTHTYWQCSGPAPVVMHICHESRDHAARTGLYRHAFTSGTDPRYAWVNFALDTVSVGYPGRGLLVLEDERPYIERLRFGCMNHAIIHEENALRVPEFPRLRTLDLLCWDGVWSWADDLVYEYRDFGPGDRPLHVTYIDKGTGMMMDSNDLQELGAFFIHHALS